MTLPARPEHRAALTHSLGPQLIWHLSLLWPACRDLESCAQDLGNSLPSRSQAEALKMAILMQYALRKGRLCADAGALRHMQAGALASVCAVPLPATAVANNDIFAEMACFTLPALTCLQYPHVVHY